MQKLEYYTFRVRSRDGRVFPLEMLRVDKCWPENEIGSAVIGISAARACSRAGQEIMLGTYQPNGWGPSSLRWTEYGWDLDGMVCHG